MITIEYIQEEIRLAKKNIQKAIFKKWPTRVIFGQIYLRALRQGEITLTIEYSTNRSEHTDYYNVAL